MSLESDAVSALRALLTAKHINLGDLVYRVRESEGEGWDGPAVNAWSNAVQAAERALKRADVERFSNVTTSDFDGGIVRRLRRIGEIPAFDQHVGDEVREAADEIENLRGALKVTHRALFEVSHAQQSGANWYTRGESGLYQQVAMWVRKGFEAIDSVRRGGFNP